MKRFWEWITTGLLSLGLFVGIGLSGQNTQNEIATSQLKQVTQNTPIYLEQSQNFNSNVSGGISIVPFGHGSHVSHGSHGSHSSHVSHYSSR